ncbi:YbjN domain-containing protein [Psychrobacter sp. M9-54-1]|uniref:YbjN domain-containing protein n=1 Tax=Psychrobacter sp. M9-54-1 TaxID=2782386 RepID=UPI00190CAAFC|nr:YbjN domain-containing protein [Psychrobacter sp. M9-54-1]MBK3392582.1 YbjN domain-containing protein [Psychrobacter sp. M9-54-1]
MSQSSKLSLWQRIKQLLSMAAEQATIDDTKIDNDLDLDSDLSSDSSLTKQDKNNAYPLENEGDSNKDNGIESCLKDTKGNKNDDTDISGSSTDLNYNVNRSANHSVDNHVDNHFDEVIYSSLSSNLDSRLDSSTDTDTDAYFDFDNGIDSMTQQNALNDTPIVNYLKQYFDDQQWHYNHYRPKSSGSDNNDSQQSHYLSFRMRNKNLDCGYLFRVQEHNNLLAVYGILPFLIPESHQSAAMLLITQINYDMLIGNLEMDINDGEIRYKNAIDVEAVGMDESTIDHLLQSVIAMTTVTYEIFSDLVNNQNPATELQELLMALYRQEDARTFFLPTQFVQ